RRDRPGLAPGSLTARLTKPSLSLPRDGFLAAIRPLGPGCPLGGGHLRALLDPVALERPRNVGRGAAEGRPCDRVRRARAVAATRARARVARAGARDRVRRHRRAPPALRARSAPLGVR